MGRHSQDSDKDEKSTEADTDVLDGDSARSSKADSFWEKVGVEPVEIALPKGTGLTLRAYRMSDTIDLDRDAEEQAEAESDDETQDAEAEVPEEEPKKSKGKDKKKSKADSEEKDSDEEDSEDEDAKADDEDSADDDEDDEDDEDEKDPVEEVPVFLSDGRSLPLFETPKALVDFVKSDVATQLSQIDTWDELVKGIKPEYVVANEEDSYELDLVVKNLRGGHDTWDAELIVGAAELSRDLGHSLRIPSVATTLSPGSPLDDLDNALRSMINGGLRAMFAKRKMRKIGKEQTALAWRGIINKISESVDWRN
ncbi:MAG TPA: hypothetical protein H9902_15515 [Candidatus Stackebrandtia faecavium]|nr:hypothetical protein [Candidatus Stackebrandtia faecavium]